MIARLLSRPDPNFERVALAGSVRVICLPGQELEVAYHPGRMGKTETATVEVWIVQPKDS